MLPGCWVCIGSKAIGLHSTYISYIFTSFVHIYAQIHTHAYMYVYTNVHTYIHFLISFLYEPSAGNSFALLFRFSFSFRLYTILYIQNPNQMPNFTFRKQRFSLYKSKFCIKSNLRCIFTYILISFIFYAALFLEVCAPTHIK